jgi:hypothetical protein
VAAWGIDVDDITHTDELLWWGCASVRSEKHEQQSARAQRRANLPMSRATGRRPEDSGEELGGRASVRAVPVHGLRNGAEGPAPSIEKTRESGKFQVSHPRLDNRLTAVPFRFRM